MPGERNVDAVGTRVVGSDRYGRTEADPAIRDAPSGAHSNEDRAADPGVSGVSWWGK